MPGIIIVRASSSEIGRIVDMLSRMLEFLILLPFPKAFLLETKLIVGRDGVTMRGRDATTKEIKTLRVTAGATTTREIRHFFSY